MKSSLGTRLHHAHPLGLGDLHSVEDTTAGVVELKLLKFSKLKNLLMLSTSQFFLYYSVCLVHICTAMLPVGVSKIDLTKSGP